MPSKLLSAGLIIDSSQVTPLGHHISQVNNSLRYVRISALRRIEPWSPGLQFSWHNAITEFKKCKTPVLFSYAFAFMLHGYILFLMNTIQYPSSIDVHGPCSTTCNR